MILTVAITAFTIVFPVSKYFGLAYVIWGRNDSVRLRSLRWIKNLGQWSMGDVFVVALLVVILRINTLATSLHVEPRPGLYVFAASVITSMVVSVLLAFEEDRVDLSPAVQERLFDESSSSRAERSPNEATQGGPSA
jgi:uncharacterized paraquat-inducible protein A